MPKTPQQLIARKMELESKWNQLWLEEGKVSMEMHLMGSEIKAIVRELMVRDLENAESYANRPDYENHAFAS